jgi:glycosyltransferase involved in cell wall biosynthesis
MRLRLAHVFTVAMSLRFLRGQARFMREHGFDVTCISSPGDEQAAFARDEGADVVSVSMARAITPFADLVAVFRLWWLFRRLAPDIVHSHTPKGGLLGMIAAWLARVPVRVYHMRGLPFETAHGFSRRILVASEKISCALAHRVICNSHSLKAVALAERLCPRDKIVTLLGGSGNGVDALETYAPERAGSRGTELRRRLAIDGAALVVGFVGRMVRDKGVPELVDAWQRVVRVHPTAHLVLGGPNEPRDPIPPATLDAIRRTPSIHAIGHVADPRDVYAAADVIVLPSHREGFPNVPLEAAAMGLPVVTTRVAGCIDSIEDGVTGTLVSVGNAGELAAAISEYLSDSTRRRSHGRAGRARVLLQFEQNALWTALLAEYDALLGQRGRRQRSDVTASERERSAKSSAAAEAV